MVQLEIRNPDDLTSSYDQVEIQKGILADGSDMTALAIVALDTTKASDLSVGYTLYIDANGTVDVNYYRFRYKNSGSSIVTSWSDIYLAGQTLFHNRFRRKMRDTNSNNYYFTNSDITDYIRNAVNKLWPHTWQEGVDETLSAVATTQKYTFPLGVVRVNDIEYIDGYGDSMGVAMNWSVRGRQIIFNGAPRVTYLMRLFVEKRFTKIAEVPESFDDLIMDFMRLEAYETMEADRTRFYKYTTTVTPDGGNVPSIRNIIAELKASTRERLNQLRRVRRAVTYSYS